MSLLTYANENHSRSPLVSRDVILEKNEAPVGSCPAEPKRRAIESIKPRRCSESRYRPTAAVPANRWSVSRWSVAWTLKERLIWGSKRLPLARGGCTLTRVPEGWRVLRVQCENSRESSLFYPKVGECFGLGSQSEQETKVTAEPDIATTMEFTGERMVPEGAPRRTFWEHVERYRFALKYVGNLDVLDIACGEGYGSAALKSAGAKSVIGVDIAPDAVAHARRKYGIDARVGSANAIPIPDRSIDLVVSFETIEHIVSPSEFVQECWRVLRPGGRAIISTPNRVVYSKGEYVNPFHFSEMTFAEFTAVLEQRFKITKIFGQCFPAAGWQRILGGGLIRGAMLKMLRPERLSPLTGHQRGRILEIIAHPVGDLASALGYETVREHSQSLLEQATYLVAIVEKESP